RRLPAPSASAGSTPRSRSGLILCYHNPLSAVRAVERGDQLLPRRDVEVRQVVDLLVVFLLLAGRRLGLLLLLGGGLFFLGNGLALLAAPAARAFPALGGGLLRRGFLGGRGPLALR